MNRQFIVAMLLVFSSRLAWSAEPIAELIEVHKIWDRAPHNAFTDLTHWKGRFVCAFREGRGHVSSDGKIRALISSDGDAWQPAALVALEGYDLRDAGLSITPDHPAGGARRLMLIGGASPRKTDTDRAPTGSFVSFTEDGKNWTPPHIVTDPGRWLWRITWHDDTAYGVSYAAGSKPLASALLTSRDGLEYRELVPTLLDAGGHRPKGSPTEAVLRFSKSPSDGDEALYCLHRRDGQSPSNTAMLGVSKPPYREWEWHDLGLYFGGPNLVETPDWWIAAGRILADDGPKTVLAWLDVEKKTLKPILELPSGGDTSYPGLVWRQGRLWVSYYASHEGKASIYMAKVALHP
jgi:hypothetical protein